MPFPSGKGGVAAIDVGSPSRGIPRRDQEAHDTVRSAIGWQLELTLSGLLRIQFRGTELGFQTAFGWN